jgi:hypothetical protein
VWALQHTAEKLILATVSAPATSFQTVNLPSGYYNARMLVLDDTGGLGTAKRVLDTYIVTGNSYRLPSGGYSLVCLFKVYNGTNAIWFESRIST